MLGLIRRSNPGLVLILICILLSACGLSPEEIAATAAVETAAAATSTPTITLTITPTPTLISSPDMKGEIEAATMFFKDFETGYPSAVSNQGGVWGTRTDLDSNTMFCNEDVDEWSSLLFGSTNWENYAISVRFKYLSINDDSETGLYLRITDNFEAYQAKNWNWGKVSLSYFPPPQDLKAVVTDRFIENKWYEAKVLMVEDNIHFYIDGDSVIEITDTNSSSGRSGYFVSPNTVVCIDDIRVWGLDSTMNPADTQTAQSDNPLEKYEGDCDFCFIDGSDPSMPIRKEFGFAPNPDDQREVVVLDENFLVAEGEEIIFENKIVWVRPNNRKDIDIFGTLVIKESLVLWDQTQHQQTRLRVRNGGTFHIADSYAFSSNEFWANWDYDDGSTIYLDNYKGEIWTGMSGSVDYTAINYSTVNLTIDGTTNNSIIQISNAHHVYFELQFPPGNHTIALPPKQKWNSWSISNIWSNTTIDVINSFFFQLDVNVNNNTHLTVENSPAGFGIGLPIFKVEPGYVYCEISNMGNPDPELETEETFYEHEVWELPCVNTSITLINSALEGAWPQVTGYVQLKISNSRLVDPRNYGSPAIMEIYNSLIANVASYHGGQIYIENSILLNDLEVKDAGSAIYTFQVGGRNVYFPFQIYEYEGGKHVVLYEKGAPWE